jgi:hypothetical protein
VLHKTRMTEMQDLLVHYLRPDYLREDYVRHGLLNCLLEEVTGRPVRLVADANSADISILTPFDVKRIFRRAGQRFLGNFVSTDLTQAVRKMPLSPRVLFVSFENLQHPAWREIGSAILSSRLPRLTAFPNSIDPAGERLPYWWNYLDWEKFPRPSFQPVRYGRLYSLQKFLEPLPKTKGRLEKACFVGSYAGGPRELMLTQAERDFGLDRYGEAGERFEGPKVSVLEKYRYSVGAENSFGFGYDTEKLPEVWDAGCLPVATFAQPMSDFNPLAIVPGDPSSAYKNPLLLKEPSPKRVLDYLDKLF